MAEDLGRQFADFGKAVGGALQAGPQAEYEQEKQAYDLRQDKQKQFDSLTPQKIMEIPLKKAMQAMQAGDMEAAIRYQAEANEMSAVFGPQVESFKALFEKKREKFGDNFMETTDIQVKYIPITKSSIKPSGETGGFLGIGTTKEYSGDDKLKLRKEAYDNFDRFHPDSEDSNDREKFADDYTNAHVMSLDDKHKFPSKLPTAVTMGVKNIGGTLRKVPVTKNKSGKQKVYSASEENKIKTFMEKNKIKSRKEAIKVLTDNGILDG